jgi:hypothetical protein
MSVKELRRVHVIRQTMEEQLTQVKASILLGLTPRHIRRLPRAGGAGRRPRARASGTGQAVEPTEIPDSCKAMALQLCEQRYGDFGPTLAAEKLTERHGITLSDEPLRRWLRERGVVHFTRRKRPHRAWRARVPLRVDGLHR